MEIRTENIVLAPVMQMRDERVALKMNEYLDRVLSYQLAMTLARSMQSLGIICEEEYRKIDTIIANKYGISLDSIYRQ